jgi:hypothetical protein
VLALHRAAAAAALLGLLLLGLLLPGVGPASGAAVPGCVAAHLSVRRGATEGATSHRFTRFRITNTGTRECRLSGVPTFRFRDPRGRRLGFASVPAGMAAHVVVLQPGDRTRVTLGRVVPGPVPRTRCRPRRAGSVDLRLAHRPHVYRLAYAATVCTTRRYRPTAYPVGF